MSFSSLASNMIASHGGTSTASKFDILPPEALINWFPGHMAKTSSQIASRLPHCSHIIDLRDARIPLSSANESLDRIIAPSLNLAAHPQWSSLSSESLFAHSRASHSPTSALEPSSPSQISPNTTSKLKRIIVFNKTDLADPKITGQWRRYFETHQRELGMVEDPIWMSLMSGKLQDGGHGGKWSEKQRKSFRALLQGLYHHPKDAIPNSTRDYIDRNQFSSEEEFERFIQEGKYENKALPTSRAGLPFRPHVSLVIGLPNVGKSTLINQLTGKKGAAVSPRPATTRVFQLFKIDPREEGGSSSRNNIDPMQGNDDTGYPRRSSMSRGASMASRGRSKVKLTPRTIELPPATAFSSSSPSTTTIGPNNNWNQSGEDSPMDRNGSKRASSSSTPTLWIMDTPGVMLPSNVDQERGLKLALCGIIADKIVPGQNVTLAKYLHHLLLTLPNAPKPSFWLRALHLPLPIDLDPTITEGDGVSSTSFDSSFNLNDFESLMNVVGRIYGKHDDYSRAQILVQAFRDGKFGQFSLESPIIDSSHVL